MPFVGEPSLTGTRLAGFTDVIAERTGLGEAIVGASCSGRVPRSRDIGFESVLALVLYMGSFAFLILG